MVDDDKRIVQKIEFQPIGGLQFFRQSNCDLKPDFRLTQMIEQWNGTVGSFQLKGGAQVMRDISLQCGDHSDA
jgi:hypothetical protein